MVRQIFGNAAVLWVLLGAGLAMILWAGLSAKGLEKNPDGTKKKGQKDPGKAIGKKKANSSKKAVTNSDQANKGMRWRVMPGARMLRMVVIKLTAPRIDEAPAKCKAKIAISTEAPGWPKAEESGG